MTKVRFMDLATRQELTLDLPKSKSEILKIDRDFFEKEWDVVDWEGKFIESGMVASEINRMCQAHEDNLHIPDELLLAIYQDCGDDVFDNDRMSELIVLNSSGENDYAGVADEFSEQGIIVNLDDHPLSNYLNREAIGRDIILGSSVISSSAGTGIFPENIRIPKELLA